MSSSRSSSSSVKNPFGSISSQLNIRKCSYYDFEYLGVKCKCDLPAPCQATWKEGTLDPGRRFFGCSQFKDPEKKCNFFLWADPSYPDRARDVINELKAKLKKRDDDLQNGSIDLNFSERKLMVLHEELGLLRHKNEEATTLLRKKLAD